MNLLHFPLSFEPFNVNLDILYVSTCIIFPMAITSNVFFESGWPTILLLVDCVRAYYVNSSHSKYLLDSVRRRPS